MRFIMEAKARGTLMPSAPSLLRKGYYHVAIFGCVTHRWHCHACLPAGDRLKNLWGNWPGQEGFHGDDTVTGVLTSAWGRLSPRPSKAGTLSIITLRIRSA